MRWAWAVAVAAAGLFIGVGRVSAYQVTGTSRGSTRRRQAAGRALSERAPR